MLREEKEEIGVLEVSSLTGGVMEESRTRTLLRETRLRQLRLLR